jgi:hypothetical protein
VSYDYKIFNAGGRSPSLEEVAESPIPFESYDSVKSALSECIPEFLALGVISVRTSHWQNVADSHRLLRNLCDAKGLALLDEQTMEFVSAT